MNSLLYVSGGVGALAYTIGLLGAPTPAVQPYADIASAKWGYTLAGIGCLMTTLGCLHVLYTNVRRTMGIYADQSVFPFYVISITSIVDYLRVVVTGHMWIMLRMVGWCIGRLAPRGIGYYMSIGPVAEDEKTLTGVAHLVVPPEGMTKDGERPQLFVFNAGTMTGSNDTSDWILTASATAKMVRQFANDPEYGGHGTGFTGNLVADFPMWRKFNLFKPLTWIIPDGHRQFNLSAWTDANAAYRWYKKSDPHKTIVQAYHEKGLETFAALLSSLQPARPIAYQNRCRNCRRMVHGYPDVDTCPDCGVKLPPMPLF